jgi:hypothetical protein
MAPEIMVPIKSVHSFCRYDDMQAQDQYQDPRVLGLAAPGVER